MKNGRKNYEYFFLTNYNCNIFCFPSSIVLPPLLKYSIPKSETIAAVIPKNKIEFFLELLSNENKTLRMESITIDKTETRPLLWILLLLLFKLVWWSREEDDEDSSSATSSGPMIVVTLLLFVEGRCSWKETEEERGGGSNLKSANAHKCGRRSRIVLSFASEFTRATVFISSSFLMKMLWKSKSRSWFSFCFRVEFGQFSPHERRFNSNEFKNWRMSRENDSAVDDDDVVEVEERINISIWHNNIMLDNWESTSCDAEEEEVWFVLMKMTFCEEANSFFVWSSRTEYASSALPLRKWACDKIEARHVWMLLFWFWFWFEGNDEEIVLIAPVASPESNWVWARLTNTNDDDEVWEFDIIIFVVRITHLSWLFFFFLGNGKKNFKKNLEHIFF